MISGLQMILSDWIHKRPLTCDEEGAVGGVITLLFVGLCVVVSVVTRED